MKKESKPSKKLRIMVSSNAPWSTSGYGQQASQFLPLMVKEGYETACVCFYGLEGGNINWNGIKCYPKMGTQWGEDALVNHQINFKADIGITLQDIWTLDLNWLKKVNRWIPIVPIDAEPTPPAIRERLKLAYRIITYSKFGYEQLKSEGFHSTYIPHTVDTQIFKPSDKSEARKAINIPDDVFLFGMVAANKDNPPRKSFQNVLDAFKKFHDVHPKSGIYMHTMLDNPSGFPIREYAKYLGIAQCIYEIPLYELSFSLGQNDMPNIYNIMDCLLSPSLNEGFGVPIIEAMSCGIPVIANDFTAMRDLIEEGVTGYKTEVLEKRFSPLLSYQGVPDTNSLYEKMELVFKADRVKMGKKARGHIEKEYDLTVVWRDRWIPFIQKLENEIYLDTKSKKQ